MYAWTHTHTHKNNKRLKKELNRSEEIRIWILPQQKKASKLSTNIVKTWPQLLGKESSDPVIGRDEEIRRTMQVLSRRTKNNPLLIDEPGVGKTAIAEGHAQRIISNDVPEQNVMNSTHTQNSPPTPPAT